MPNDFGILPPTRLVSTDNNPVRRDGDHRMITIWLVLLTFAVVLIGVLEVLDT
jgi:hypothetical protein